MPWARIDDSFWHHPKILRLPRRSRLQAVGLYVLALSWSNRLLTDGIVTPEAVEKLDGSTSLADELVSVGLWDRRGGNYRIHDFLHYSKSRLRVEEERAFWRDKKRESRGYSNGESHGDTP